MNARNDWNDTDRMGALYESLDASASARNLERGEAIRAWLHQNGSRCGSRLSVGVGVIWSVQHTRFEIGDDVTIGSYSVMGGGGGKEGESRSLLRVGSRTAIGHFFSLDSIAYDLNATPAELVATHIGAEVTIGPRVTVEVGTTIVNGVNISGGSLVRREHG